MKRVMKRALAADRAKLDLPPSTSSSGAGSPPPPTEGSIGVVSSSIPNGRIGHISSPPEGQPPFKLQRIPSEEQSSAREIAKETVSSPSGVKEESTPSVVGNVASVPPSPRTSRTIATDSENTRGNNSTTPSSHKRPRRETSANQSHQTEENDSSSAFYLHHQNRALAVELKSLQDQVRELTQEREYRRKSCLQAVQALHSLQATWTSLETALGKDTPPAPISLAPPSPSMTTSTVGNTDHTAVEWTSALHRALRALGNQNRLSNNDDDDTDCTNGGTQAEPVNLGQMAANIADRADCLQTWLWQLLRTKHADGVLPSKQNMDEEYLTLKHRITHLEDETKRLRSQTDELIQCREDLIIKERRLRRNIYRLDVGMISQKQLIQSVAANVENVDEDPERIEVQKEAVFRGFLGSDIGSGSATNDSFSALASSGQNASVSAKLVLDLQGELEDSRREVSNREKSIEEMNVRIRDLERRINELIVKQQSEGDREKLESLESLSRKLTVAENEAKELAEKLETIREKWAQSAGNEKTLMKSLEELQDKHQKRWNELTASEESRQENGDLTLAEEQARKIVELEHKLRQAIENVRQAETARTNLRDALVLNESLQAKLEELKAKQNEKYEKVDKTEKNERTNPKSSSSNDNSATPSGSKGEGHAESKSHSESKSHHHRESTGGSERISAEKAEKIYRENKKMRKEIAAIMASKEGHKAKLERVEKERNAMLDINARLLKQAAEKDEMNAKSLASILHLKSLTEHLTLERENFEQQLKSAEQLALAARLATNSKDRLHEEFIKEKARLEEEIRELENRYVETKRDLSLKNSECANVSGRTAILKADLANVSKRCDEFVIAVEEQKEESRKLLDALDKAERQAREAREKLAVLSKNSHGESENSGFTTEQLKTQIQVLKNRLACPVCHYRDKECIIMRCRHMHCRQCVEERLANRSRRCPTCNNPFGRSDMEDIFLG